MSRRFHDPRSERVRHLDALRRVNAENVRLRASLEAANANARMWQQAARRQHRQDAVVFLHGVGRHRRDDNDGGEAA
jgi:hypothetical protein